MEQAHVMARIINHIDEGIVDEYSFVQQYGLKAGIKKFGQRGKDAAHDEMKQLNYREVFTPIDTTEMTFEERKKSMESLIFLVEKRDGRIKGRTCANGSVQREYIGREEATSPTASTDAVILTAIIDAKQGRDVMVADVPHAFVQTSINKERLKKGDRVIMKIRGVLVDMLENMNPAKYHDFVKTDKKGNKMLYVMMLKALYGMLIASLLYYKKFLNDIKKIGFETNPYDPCVANRIVNGKQHALTWHVDDIKSSHLETKVNDHFKEWLEMKYGEDGIGKVKVTRGAKHDYLAMNLDFSERGKVKINMIDYATGMCNDFPEKLGHVSTPWTDNLFKDDDKLPPLTENKKKTFHTFTMKGMFLCKRARQDLQPGIAFFSTRTSKPNIGDWKKLVRFMNFLNSTKEDVLTLEADDSQTIRWHIDAAFAVHQDYKSQTGATCSLGKGSASSSCLKQKSNTRSSTEAEMVGADDVVTKVVWTQYFITAQGFKVKTIVYRDNTSALKLEINGKASSGKRTRHFHIKYFYITDLIKRQVISVEYCPTDQMVGDYMTKPLVGFKFKYFRAWILNLPEFDELASRSVLANKTQNVISLNKKEKIMRAPVKARA